MIRKVAILAVSIIALTTGCSSGEGAPDAEAAVFAGLDPATVTDVLNSRAAQENVEILDAADRDSMWQGMVANFALCRDMLQVYTTWRDTGLPPSDLPVPTVPDEPQPSFPDVESAYAYFSSLVDSGDISQLREALTSGNGCGAWVPAAAGASDGQTVAEAVRAAG